MGYEHQVHRFYGDDINFFTNDSNVLIGAKSLCEGIGLGWGSQSQKIRMSLADYCSLEKVEINKKKNKALLLCRNGSQYYLDRINETKLKLHQRERLKVYRNNFYNFTFECVTCEKLIDIEDAYTKTRNGVRSMINDSVTGLHNPNAVDILSSIIHSLLHDDLQNLDSEKLRIKISSYVDPIYDLAERTAAKYKKLERLKKISTSARIEKIAEVIRDTDRESSLELVRISKSLQG